MVEWAREYRASFEAAQLGDMDNSGSKLEDTWHPPNPGFIHVNVDVALPAGQNFFQIGLVARNSDGQVVWWRVKQISGRPNPTDGEAMAVLYGVLLARDKAWSHVIVESDCLPVFRSLQSSYISSHSFASFGTLIDACLDEKSSFLDLSFSFVRRSGNSLAILLRPIWSCRVTRAHRYLLDLMNEL